MRISKHEFESNMVLGVIALVFIKFVLFKKIPLEYFWAGLILLTFYSIYKAWKKQQELDLNEEKYEKKKREEDLQKNIDKYIKEIIDNTVELYEKKYSHIYRNSKSPYSLNDLRKMEPREFEVFMGKVYTKLGYRVEVTPTSNDGGKDMVLHDENGKKIVVECKKYSPTTTVGRPLLQQFSAVVLDEEASEGWFLNLGAYSAEAVNYAYLKKIKLLSAKDICELITKAEMYVLSKKDKDFLIRLDASNFSISPAVFLCPICESSIAVETDEKIEHCGREIMHISAHREKAYKTFVEKVEDYFRVKYDEYEEEILKLKGRAMRRRYRHSRYR